jgi:hypothetical protein
MTAFRIPALRVAFGLLLASGAVARAQSADELLHACEMLQRGMHVEGDKVYFPPSAEAYKCWGFMSAVTQYSVLADQNGKTLLGACPGPDTTPVDVLRVFVDYANAHPDKLGLKAAAAAYNAMADAFPCK